MHTPLEIARIKMKRKPVFFSQAEVPIMKRYFCRNVAEFNSFLFMLGSFSPRSFDIPACEVDLHFLPVENVPDEYLLHLNVGIYALFSRLYGMYPSHFVQYLQEFCTKKNAQKQLFSNAIEVGATLSYRHPPTKPRVQLYFRFTFV